MRGIGLMVAVLLVAGCSAPPNEERAPGVNVVLLGVEDARAVEPGTATLGGGEPATPFNVTVGNETVSIPGGAATVSLFAIGGSLRMTHDGESVRTSMRWIDQGCRVDVWTSYHHANRTGGRIPLEATLHAASPVQHYVFQGGCEGHIFALLR